MDKDYLIIESASDLYRIAVDEIIYISSDHNYSNIHLINSNKILISLQLGKIEELILKQLKKNGWIFVRVGRELIVSRLYIHKIDVSKKELEMMAGYKGKSRDYNIYKVDQSSKPVDKRIHNLEFTMKDEYCTYKLNASKEALSKLKETIINERF